MHPNINEIAKKEIKNTGTIAVNNVYISNQKSLLLLKYINNGSYINNIKQITNATTKAGTNFFMINPSLMLF